MHDDEPCSKRGNYTLFSLPFATDRSSFRGSLFVFANLAIDPSELRDSRNNQRINGSLVPLIPSAAQQPDFRVTQGKSRKTIPVGKGVLAETSAYGRISISW